ncbi:hypothetical protein SARC_03363 [Sphaeroforma arctica JP610]|uniref:Uncharacterized protein n=1 Tax=Sphaeroforma arctica JP610 TaxID=667725 RepID=A0A0L0G6A3_9EUKA|nr:hypothetical protein SARC_03363 [Sphaeroforma arctica JP610]KNC84401.1 hypothetical protein SARC_03363 [Sphaeroforma arctica JP610]|eukprot:XP_014158303.1 hypothetical protein SARC_03363 [Sphaeroforma arctica JP610]
MMMSKKGSALKFDERGSNISMFPTTQYDFVDIHSGAKYACTSIAVLAGSVLLTLGEGSAKAFATEESVRTLIEEGCKLQGNWIDINESRNSKGMVQNMAAVDEICNLEESPARAAPSCLWGQLCGKDYGMDIADAVRSLVVNKNEVTVYVLTVHKHSTMVAFLGKSGVIVFDSHRRERRFGLAPGANDESGSVLVRLKDTESLISYFHRLYCATQFPESLFTLQQLTAEGANDVAATHLINRLALATSATVQFSLERSLPDLTKKLSRGNNSSNSLSSISSMFKKKTSFFTKRPALPTA